MKVLFDLNVLLDLLLDREPWSSDAQKLVGRVIGGEIVGYVAVISVPTLFYVLRKEAGGDKARLAVERVLQTFEVAAADRDCLEEALRFPGTDYEDNVQVACGTRAGVDVIVTRDATGFRGSPVPALTPTELLLRLQPNP